MAMVNFDMVGSPNYVRFVYDGDNSAFPVGPGAAEGPPGSAYLEGLFLDYFPAVGLAIERTPFAGGRTTARSSPRDPGRGLFTGAEGVKTAAQAPTYGGTAGPPYDPCYHLACDTFARERTPPGVRHAGLDPDVGRRGARRANARTSQGRCPSAEAVSALRTSGSLVVDSPGPEELPDR